MSNGVVDATHHERARYWKHWTKFMQQNHLDPHMQTLNDNQQVEWLCTFASRVRARNYGRGHQVRAATVQVALRAIGTAFELDQQRNPTYDRWATDRRYWARIRQQIEGFRCADPPTQAQLAVPVDVAHWGAHNARSSSDPHTQATGDLMNIAFYYLLRVGEYTWTGTRQRRRTKQFRVQDVTFRKGNFIIPNSAPLHQLLKATSATLTITNQKNGIQNQSIHHQATGKPGDPIVSLAHRVHHIMSHSGNKQNTCLSAYYKQSTCHQVWSSRINKAVKLAVQNLGLTRQGFALSQVSSHSLRAGGAMALKLHGYDRDTIKKIGRWSSDTFLTYIHEQISAFSAGLSSAMAIPIPFHNIAAAATITASA